MRCALGWLAACGLLLAGCQTQTTTVEVEGSATAAAAQPSGAGAAEAPSGEPAGTAEPSGAPSADPAADNVPAGAGAARIEAGTATLSPENTTITFVGTHSPPKAPDPRVGGFKKFSGLAEIDGKTLKSVSVAIDTGSLSTEFEKLTAHLNSPDFFDTRQYPTAKFESTKIAAGDDGQTTITGNLTLLKTTKEISFPAKVAVTDAGLSLQASFEIDRVEFGVGEEKNGVERPVKLTVAVGEPTKGS